MKFRQFLRELMYITVMAAMIAVTNVGMIIQPLKQQPGGLSSWVKGLIV